MMARARKEQAKEGVPMQTSLLPYFDSPLTKAVKSVSHFLANPFFELDRKAKRRELTYQDGAIKIEMKALEGQGLATIYDRDLLLYVGSLMAQKIKNGEIDPAKAGSSEEERTFIFTANDFIRIAGRDRSGRGYDRIEEMVDRLKGTMVKTNIKSGRTTIKGYFSWLSDGTMLEFVDDEEGKPRLRFIRVVLCKWLYESMLGDANQLELVPEYFGLTPIARRLYDLAHVNCQGERLWEIDLGSLHKQVGCSMLPRKFADELRAIAEADVLPQYRFRFTDKNISPRKGRGRPPVNGVVIEFTPRDVVLEGATPRQPDLFTLEAPMS